MKEKKMNVTEALKKLADASEESILLVHDPSDGLFVVVRWEDDHRRMAFLGSDATDLDGDALALHLLVRAAKYLVDQAMKDVNGHRAVRLRIVESEIAAAING